MHKIKNSIHNQTAFTIILLNLISNVNFYKMDLSELLQGPLGNQMIEGVKGQLGIDTEKAKSAVSSAVPVLVSALNNNVKGGGAESLLNALNKHDGSILDNLSGFLDGGDFSDGAGILSHVLGDNQSKVENALGVSSGLSSSQISKMLMILAPIVMGYLGKQRQKSNVDSGGLGDLLGGLLGGGGQSDLLESILNSGGKKSSGGGLMDIGSKILGGLFGGKK